MEEIVLDEEDIEGVKKKFKIEDLETANWAFRKLKAIEEKKKEIEELANQEMEPYEKEIARIKKWKEDEFKQYDHSINFFSFLLEEYYREQRKVDAKFKLSTPYGKITSRKQQPKWNYEEDRLLKWLKANDLELIRTKEEVDKNELKKKYQVVSGNVVTENGEIVEGITIEEREATVKVEVVD
ncbi:MAG: hypothetical protein GX053_12700 [Tissierella sp.]|nr:hypothetical protein [Tissierella sp.]